jgi:hypothetical protein
LLIDWWLNIEEIKYKNRRVELQNAKMADYKIAPPGPILRDVPPSYSFLRQRKLCHKDGDFSHTVICGRLKRILIDRNELLFEFYEQVAQDWRNGVPTFFNEIACPIHILFFDLDFLLPPAADWTDADSLAMTSVAHQAVCEIYGNAVAAERLTCIAMGTDPTLCRKDSGVFKKMGLHPYWPRIYVNVETHKKVRSVVIRRLQQQLGNNAKEGVALKEDWWTVVDLAPIATPKLRLALSNKADKCGCKRTTEDEKKQCDARHFHGKGDFGRQHHVIAVLEEDGSRNRDEEKKLLDEPVYLLKRVSLRRTADEPTAAEFPAELKQWQEEDAKHSSRAAAAGDGGKKGKKGKSLDDGDPMKEMVLKIIKVFTNIERGKVTHVYFAKKTKIYTIVTSSKLCFNKGSDHIGNNVWYQVSTRFTLFSPPPLP